MTASTRATQPAPASTLDTAELVARFCDPPLLSMDDEAACRRLRASAQTFARLVGECCPPGREASLAVTNVEQAMLWAVTAVERGAAADVRAAERAKADGHQSAREALETLVGKLGADAVLGVCADEVRETLPACAGGVHDFAGGSHCVSCGCAGVTALEACEPCRLLGALAHAEQHVTLAVGPSSVPVCGWHTHRSWSELPGPVHAPRPYVRFGMITESRSDGGVFEVPAETSAEKLEEAQRWIDPYGVTVKRAGWREGPT